MGKAISPVFNIRNNSLVECSRSERIKCWFSSSYDKRRAEKVNTFLLEAIEKKEFEHSPLLRIETGYIEGLLDDLLEKARLHILSSQNKKHLSKITKAFDHALAAKRPSISYITPQIQSRLKKWTQAGLKPEWFHAYPDFVAFLERTRLLSQMKIAEAPLVRVFNNQPEIMVEGYWISFENLKKEFRSVYSPRYHEHFLVDRTNRVYTYLDNGRGLEVYHPYSFGSVKGKSIRILSEEEYQRTLQTAQLFVREEESGLSEEAKQALKTDRSFILQIVSSHIEGSKSNMSEFLKNSKHPYIRVIIGKDNPSLGTKKGEVYEIGFGWKSKPKLPFQYIEGQFRSPDIWSYQTAKERLVTNIAVSQDEASEVYQFISRYYNESTALGYPIGFQLRKQNCSVFVRKALETIHINVPTQMSFKATLYECSPDWMRSIVDKIKSCKARLSTLLSSCFIGKGINYIATKIHALVRLLIGAATTLVLAPIGAILGKYNGKGGLELEPHADQRKKLQPKLSITEWKADLNRYEFNFPGRLQQWQRKQPSTTIYRDYTKLAVVPPAAN